VAIAPSHNQVVETVVFLQQVAVACWMKDILIFVFHQLATKLHNIYKPLLSSPDGASEFVGLLA
jgi:hypothetical protein